LTLQLHNQAGVQLASAQAPLPARGHKALFLDEINWSPQVNTTNFEGILRVKSTGKVAATVIQARPNQFATLPVIPNP
jgi:hypothetical protein